MALASSPQSSGKWDAIVEGKWYVPYVNATAYGVDKLGNHVKVGFQNVYNMHIVGGHFEATTISAIAFPDGPNQFDWQSSLQPVALMTGDIDDNGHITMTITSQPGTDNPVQHAVGQMLFLAGQWRMTMQVALEGASLQAPFIVQWANMTKFDQDISIDPEVTPLSKSILQSKAYSWLKGTSWVINDSQLPSKDLVFSINEFRSGYLFGGSNSVRPIKGASLIDSRSKPNAVAVDRVSLSGDVSPAGDIFFAFTTLNGDISEAYGHIDAKPRGPVSIILKDVLTGEVVGDAKLIGRTYGSGRFDRNFDYITGGSSPSRLNSSLAKSARPALNGSAMQLANPQPFTAAASPNPEIPSKGSDWLTHSGALHSELDSFMIPQQLGHH